MDDDVGAGVLQEYLSQLLGVLKKTLTVLANRVEYSIEVKEDDKRPTGARLVLQIRIQRATRTVTFPALLCADVTTIDEPSALALRAIDEGVVGLQRIFVSTGGAVVTWPIQLPRVVPVSVEVYACMVAIVACWLPATSR